MRHLTIFLLACLLSACPVSRGGGGGGGDDDDAASDPDGALTWYGYEGSYHAAQFAFRPGGGISCTEVLNWWDVQDDVDTPWYWVSVYRGSEVPWEQEYLDLYDPDSNFDGSGSHPEMRAANGYDHEGNNLSPVEVDITRWRDDEVEGVARFGGDTFSLLLTNCGDLYPGDGDDDDSVARSDERERSPARPAAGWRLRLR